MPENKPCERKWIVEVFQCVISRFLVEAENLQDALDAYREQEGVTFLEYADWAEDENDMGFDGFNSAGPWGEGMPINSDKMIGMNQRGELD
jgi:hypothetical protein